MIVITWRQNYDLHSKCFVIDIHTVHNLLCGMWIWIKPEKLSVVARNLVCYRLKLLLCTNKPVIDL